MEQSDYMEHSFFNGIYNSPSGSSTSSSNGFFSSSQGLGNNSEDDNGGGNQGFGGGDGNHGFGGGLTTPQGFGFTITSGQVTGMTHVDGNWTFNMNLPTNATFTVDTTANTVTETITGTSSTEVLQYSPEATSSNLYQVTQDTTTWANPSTTTASGFTKGYTFTLSGGQVTGVQEVFSGSNFSVSENQHISPTATFTVNGSTITETSIEGHSIESTTYTQPSGSTLYAVAAESTTTIQPGTATTLLAVQPEDRVNFTFGSNGAVTQMQELFANGSSATITPSSQVSFNQISPGFVQETSTNGTNSSYLLFYQGSSTGPYTEIAHGSGTTVDLVGIKAQLSEIPAALLSLI